MSSEKEENPSDKVEDIEDQRTKNDDDKPEELLLPETDGLWYMGQSKKHR